MLDSANIRISYKVLPGRSTSVYFDIDMDKKLYKIDHWSYGYKIPSLQKLK